ncbi:MAG: host specificity factor TipJ family phage tail protein [Micavibrio sp.]|nr:host specificity factor TipJ family phage tail protein [Micavibrio sp.]
MTIAPTAHDNITALLRPHPFAAERIERTLPAGNSIAAIAAAMLPDARLTPHLHAFINGHAVPRESWHRVRPKAGTVLTLRLLPMGGGGSKNPLRTVLSLALLAASPALSAGLASLLGPLASFPFASRLLTTGVNLLGSLALNALAPPGRARYSAQKESPTLFIQGAQNKAAPFGRVPKVLGRHRFVPPFGALPYTETVGSDQYLRLLFVWGYGPLTIDALKIGETPLSEFEGVEIESRQGFVDDAPLTLYTNSVLQNDLAIAVTAADEYILRTSEADADEIGVDVTLPRGLVRFAGSGARKNATVRIEVQYAPAGTSDWSAGVDSYKPFPARSLALPAAPKPYRRGLANYTVMRLDIVLIDNASGALSIVKGVEAQAQRDDTVPVAPTVPDGQTLLATLLRESDEAGALSAAAITDGRAADLAGIRIETVDDFAVTASAGHIAVAAGGLQFPGIEITGKQTAALRETLTFKVPKGQYDVRLRRITADAEDDDKLFDETSWTALRSIRYAAPVTMPGLAVTALRIKATDQLTGVIDRFNGVVTSILPDWDGADWVAQETSNPASLFRHVLQGSANARPLADSRLDLEKIQNWHERCAAASREFNAVVDYDASVREILQNIAAAGRASPALLDGKWAIIEDRPQAVPVQHFTPRNTSVFQGRKSFADVADALRVRFLNRDKGWLQDERFVYADGIDAASAKTFEALDLTGITSSTQAWQDGRYHMATALLRPESYSFDCDLEHLACTRGDLIRFTHDVPLFGLASARVKSVQVAGGIASGVTLDDGVTMENGKTYALRCRKSDGSSFTASLLTVAGSTNTLLFSGNVTTADAPMSGDLAMFGEAGRESVELIVKSIAPQGNLAARLTCVDAAPAIHEADAGTIPAFDSQLSLPPDMQRPPLPVLDGIQSGEETLIRNTDGSLTTRIVVTLQPPAFGAALAPQVLIRAQDETRFRPAEMTVTGNRLSITDVAEGETYDLQVRYLSPLGISSAPLLITGHRVAGTSALPSDITGFGISVLGDAAHLSWAAVPDLDLDHYTLRFTPETDDAGWSSAIDIISAISRDATSVTVPAARGSYLLKAFDVGGRSSANAALAVTPVDDGTQNVVLSIAEDPNFPGLQTAMAVRDGALQLSGRDSVDDWPDFDAVENIDIGNDGMFSTGSYEFSETFDLGAVYASRLTATLAVAGVDLNATLDTCDDLDTLENFDQGVDPSLWQLRLQIRSTTVDPALIDAAWTPWTDFVIADYTARAFQFRLLASAASSNISPAVSSLRVTIDMPDRIVSLRATLAESTGHAVIFPGAFRALPSLSVTPHDLATGDYYTLTGQTPAGFNIRFYDASGAGIARTFDYQARGYGAES